VTESQSSFHLDVGDGHSIHVALWGNPAGIRTVFLHGGPGSGCQPGHRAIFDESRFCVAFIDQRGAGRSLPKGARHANTTAHLVADLERVRVRLGFDDWLVVGGSWGATLGLAYAQAHPDRVQALVLRATFLGTRAELDRAFGPTLSQFHPALYRDFVDRLPPQERGDPLHAYWRRILDPDPAIHSPAALDWYDTERILSEHAPSGSRLPAPAADRGLPSTPFMEAHYFSNECFLGPDALLNGAARLADIRGVIVQGRYDLLCPPATAQALAERWPAARIETVEAAGHSMAHPAIAAALQAAVASFG
jgi:proline iminopeptidase